MLEWVWKLANKKTDRVSTKTLDEKYVVESTDLRKKSTFECCKTSSNFMIFDSYGKQIDNKGKKIYICNCL